MRFIGCLSLTTVLLLWTTLFVAAAEKNSFPSPYNNNNNNNDTIDDTHCNIEDLERANDSQLHVILKELINTEFFKTFVVDLNRTCPLWKQEEEEEEQCASTDDEGEALCTVSSMMEHDMMFLESNALQSLSDTGFSSKEQADTFSWTERTDEIVQSLESPEAGDCDLEQDAFWLDMCSPMSSDGQTVNLAMNPEHNTGYQGTHIWKAIYEENCIVVQDMCLEQRVMYRLFSGLHTSTTLSIAMKYYPPSKRKGRLEWQPNPDYFMTKFQDHPEYIRNLHFSYVVMLRALKKAQEYFREYNEKHIRTGHAVQDETAHVLLKRLLDSTILESCSRAFHAFDETLLFADDRSKALQQNFKGVFHNVSSILDCVQCQQCQLHGKLAMLGFGTALKILFVKNLNLLSLEKNQVVAFINTMAKLSESMQHVTTLTQLYWQQQSQEDNNNIPFDSLDMVDKAVGGIASLGRAELITIPRQMELIKMAISHHPELLILTKHYHAADLNTFAQVLEQLNEQSNDDMIPDAIIVGSGLAGLTAALHILDRGGNVVIIEKEHLLGGNSNKASSGINAAVVGDDYDPNDALSSFYNDTLRSAGDGAQPHLIRVLVDNSVQAVTWLQERVGIDLSLKAQLGGHSHQRTHRPKNGMVGAEVIYRMQKVVRELEKNTGRVKILIDSKVTKLITEEDNDPPRVIGVEYVSTTNDHDPQVLFSKHVILATGGFASDRSEHSYLARYRPELVNMPATAGPFSTGDGISLATNIGANVMHMDQVQVHPTGWIDPNDWNNPSKILAAELMRGVGGILLTERGGRFCNELGTRAYITDRMLSHVDPDGYGVTKKWNANHTTPLKFYLVLSSAAAEQGRKHVDLYTRKGLLNELHGIEELAKWMNLTNTDTLTNTFVEYHQAATTNTDDKYNKTTFPGVPPGTYSELQKETFYAGMVTPVLHYCMGGLTMDTQGRILNENDIPIPGLYGAGEVTGGVHGYNRLGGNSLLECTVFGTIVGKGIPIQTTRTNKEQQQTTITQTTASSETSKQRDITMSELQRHNQPEDCWLAIDGVVYDMTEFAEEHPAGAQAIYDLAGTDASKAFAAVHNKNMLDDFVDDQIGRLVVEEEESSSTSAPASNDDNAAAAAEQSTSTDRWITPQELKLHNKPDDCWVAFHGTVYNMTEFSQKHPGGAKLIQKQAGGDGTLAFSAIHSEKKLDMVKQDRVGKLQE